MKNILVTGALGQIGSELTVALRKKYGADGVIASDIRKPSPSGVLSGGKFEILDVTNGPDFSRIVEQYGIDTIYHLAAILSATGEAKPELAWRVNMDGLYTVLEAARRHECAVFFPSSIAAFGPSSPKKHTPQVTIMRPETMYGITKLSGELLCDYYFRRFGVDTRSLRFPGLISYETEPGGGTTDYAVQIFIDAIVYKAYTCYLRGDTAIDMMYMPDAIRAMIDLMEADGTKLTHRNAYNLTAMSFTPEILAAEIRKYIPDFKMTYAIDRVRQAIADSWPDLMDDSAARAEWGWAHEYDLPRMTKIMIEMLAVRLQKA